LKLSLKKTIQSELTNTYSNVFSLQVSLYQRFYGESIASNNTQSVIPNIEVFLAQQSIKANNPEEPPEKKEPEAIKRLSPEKKIEIIPAAAAAASERERLLLNKGPTKQIETRTADGKRRITPKFLPITEDDCNSAALR
jgi:hypothetical protein